PQVRDVGDLGAGDDLEDELRRDAGNVARDRGAVLQVQVEALGADEPDRNAVRGHRLARGDRRREGEVHLEALVQEVAVLDGDEQRGGVAAPRREGHGELVGNRGDESEGAAPLSRGGELVCADASVGADALPLAGAGGAVAGAQARDATARASATSGSSAVLHTWRSSVAMQSTPGPAPTRGTRPGAGRPRTWSASREPCRRDGLPGPARTPRPSGRRARRRGRSRPSAPRAAAAAPRSPPWSSRSRSATARGCAAGSADSAAPGGSRHPSARWCRCWDSGGRAGVRTPSRTTRPASPGPRRRWRGVETLASGLLLSCRPCRWWRGHPTWSQRNPNV